MLSTRLRGQPLTLSIAGTALQPYPGETFRPHVHQCCTKKPATSNDTMAKKLYAMYLAGVS